jgi:3-(3-hydroxy-phenyl)propionate hydroxylase
MARLDAQVAVVGAGPIGMTLAGRLAQHGVSVVLLEQDPVHQGEGSKALCMQRETLEIWARLGIGEQVAGRGVQWSVGRTYFRGRELFSVRLPASEGDHFPPFVNISQTEVEEMLLARLRELPGVDERWGHRLAGIVQDQDGVTVTCETANGEEALRVAYAVGADGAHSSVRRVLGASFPGHSYRDLFLICDIQAHLPFPNERRFHFDPPWNPGRQVLIHPQPDDAWRIDWQVSPETDVEAERGSGALDRRIRQVIGRETDYALLWVTAYRFHQRVADRFRIGRVFLAGDAAHVVSPFGARGLNSGVADAENLAWKLGLVLAGSAPDALLDTYHAERRAAALENEAVTDATMRFMVPHGPLRRAQRNAILRGSLRLRGLRRFVNSGRLAQPSVYDHSPITLNDAKPDRRLPQLGSVLPDAACAILDGAEKITRLRDLVGDRFLALLVVRGEEAAASAAVRAARLSWAAPCRVALLGSRKRLAGVTVITDPRGELRRIFGGASSYAFLVRPDGHLAAALPLSRPDAVDSLTGLQARVIGA